MNQHQTSSEEADRGEEVSDQGLVWRLMLLRLRHCDGSGQMCGGEGRGGATHHSQGHFWSGSGLKYHLSLTHLCGLKEGFNLPTRLA